MPPVPRLHAFLLCVCLPACAPPPVAPAPIPAPPPPLSLTLDYRPDFALRVSEAGRPVDAQARIAAGTQSVNLAVHDGRALVDADTMARVSLWEMPLSLTLPDGRSVAIPSEEGSHPFRCMTSLAALRDGAWCENPLPTGTAAPPQCDAFGALAYRTLLEQIRSNLVATCWSSLDVERLRHLPGVEPPLRDEACRRLVSLTGADTGDEITSLLVEPCAGVLPGDLTQKWTRAKLLRELPAAFAIAKEATSSDMRRFFEKFGTTGDPRVGEIKALALGKFGPKNLKQFGAAQRAIAALDKSTPTTLCNFRDGIATVAISGWNGVSAAPVSHGARVCAPGVPLATSRRRGRPAPKGLAATVRSFLGPNTQLQLNRGCSYEDLWYLP